jgi:hypothetical protein
MRYIVATVGAFIMLVAVTLIGIVANKFLPPAFDVWTLRVPWGVVWVRGPMIIVGFGLGLVAAVHSFRSTLKRYRLKDAEKKDADPGDRSVPG